MKFRVTHIVLNPYKSFQMETDDVDVAILFSEGLHQLDLENEFPFCFLDFYDESRDEWMSVSDPVLKKYLDGQITKVEFISKLDVLSATPSAWDGL